MKPLVVILLILAVVDVVFNHAAVVLAIWGAAKGAAAGIHRGIWASQ